MSVYKKITNIVAESIDEASMKNKELITELSVKLGWTSKEVTEMLAAFGVFRPSWNLCKLADNDAVYLQGFGLFEVKKKAERISVNPASGKRYLVPPKLVPVFKPGATLKSKLKELSDNE